MARIEVGAAIAPFTRAGAVVWAQEEPANMGAWTYVRDRLEAVLGPSQRLTYAGRRASASPAVGSMRVHKAEQAVLIDEAFAELA